MGAVESLCLLLSMLSYNYNGKLLSAEILLKEAGMSVIPWDDAGSWLRFSVTFEAGSEDEEKRIINEMKNRLSALKLVF